MATKHKKPERSAPKALVLGIDTGGTYTDGVLLEYHDRKVLASHKSLTTKQDFSIGIKNVIKAIDIQNPAAIQMVSVSTTLATNAIAEGKGKRVALFLIGYDPELVASFKMEEAFATPHFFYFTGGHDLYGQEKNNLDLPAILEKIAKIKDQVDAIAVSSYFSPLNPEHETRAYNAISQVCDLPIVLGHQLSTKLGSVERATTAALNASLIGILQDFIIAVRHSMEERGIDAPLMVVRGDGTLMSDEFAARSPVETIHSGPAASAIGGRFLSHLDDALIVDVGGTTTDFALIQKGEVDISEEGATVSNYKTAVKAANLLSIGLGGDSHIALDRENNIAIGPARVVPLSYLAHKYPQVEKRLKPLAQGSFPAASPLWLEHWFLLREPDKERMRKGTREKELLKILREGPKPVPELVKELGLLHKNQLGVDELLRQEIIGVAGFTPTDLLHIDGRHSPWNTQAAIYGLDILSNYLSWDKAGITEFVWSHTTEIIIRAILVFLNETKYQPKELLSNNFAHWFFNNSINPAHPQLETSIRLRQPIIGIGAPAEIFLKDVADKLNTDLILPEHYQAANAVGAIAGSVMVEEKILIYPHLTKAGLDVIGYYVQASDGRQEFEKLDDALKHARTQTQENALNAALQSGADNPQVTMEEIADGLDTYRIQAKAIGNPRLMK
ncbi:MAG: hydantoinase/oxoprolinase family protein [Anaerolineae bacterium]|nr:hydantoinase/oxoprolinase family protein [Anaerolineae bacterium]MBT7189208.1 hydantoinase/oxoprolinase family protein [Anaerolineae bacterium]MBT7991127.1 hydantoinase/oxoprolinase family protein [Anaerolineae bacterium]